MITHGLEENIFEGIELEEEVQALPDKQKVVVAMIASGFTQADCASIIGLTRAAVGVIWHRTLEELRGKLYGSSQVSSGMR